MNVKLLKRDALGSVEIVDDGSRVFVRRLASGSSAPFSRVIARALLERERRALRALEGLDGAPVLVEGSAAPDRLERGFVAGEPLHRCRELPLDFFDRLVELVQSMHARGVAHNDLHKEQNIVVQPDGRPALIDFQLASVHAPGAAALARRALDDLRHVAKHRRRYLRFARVADPAVSPPRELLEAPPRAPSRRGLARAWRVTGKPLYNVITRRVLRRRDGEERRETAGEWPVWTRAIGERSGGSATSHSTSGR